MHEDETVNISEIGEIQIGCKSTPRRNSYFCDKHQGSKIKMFYKNNYMLVEEDLIHETKLSQIEIEIKQIWDTFVVPESDDILYLTEFENGKYYFVNEMDIELNHIARYQKLVKQKKIIDDTTLCYSNNKLLKINCKVKAKTRGVILSSYNCGIINGYRELFGSEGIRQSLAFLLSLLENMQTIPKFLLYDRGCSLKRYIEKFKISEKSDRASKLDNIKIYVDRFHFKTHTEQWCIENCNPYNEEGLDGLK
jgi:hypothetical protein